MAHAGHKHFGPGMQGKNDGSGAMSDLDPGDVPANMVLSNRDKAQHSDDRGLDGKAVQTEQMQDHASARADEAAVDVALADEPASPDVALDGGGVDDGPLDDNPLADALAQALGADGTPPAGPDGA